MIKAYTDINQSKMLAEILSPESADMWLGCIGESMTMCHVGNYLLELQCRQDIDYRKTQPKIICPCWSLAALFDVLPEGVIDNCYVPNLQKENGKYSIAYGDEELLCIADNPIDTCYEMIMKLHEQKLL